MFNCVILTYYTITHITNIIKVFYLNKLITRTTQHKTQQIYTTRTTFRVTT